MDFCLINHDFEHAVQTVIQVFYPNQGYSRLAAVPGQGRCIVSSQNSNVFTAEVYCEAKLITAHSSTAKDNSKKSNTQAAAASIYNALTEVTGIRPSWGTLTGVRPAKLLTDGGTAEYLRDAYLVEAPKALLVQEVSAAELRYLASSTPRDAAIYISIPFCPSKCTYCSFPSYPAAKSIHMMDNYVEVLLRELAFIAEKIQKHDHHITAVYIGGGTPTALTVQLLDKLLNFIRTNFCNAYEFTVEAGRPDSLDDEKFIVMQNYGVTRLSLNPQTFSDKTLERVGRNHTSDTFFKIYNKAVQMGFDNINCDIILGLPDETADDVANTMEQLLTLRPAAITVHTLALKRAATLNHTHGRYAESGGTTHCNTAEVEQMLKISADNCRNMGLSPYYMYRQKNMAGNFENVGYSLPNKECIYNFITMTEAKPIYAAGAGAVTKVMGAASNKIARAFNLKSLDEYVSRIDEMIDRKRVLFDDFFKT
ncbi:MAG: coproporphyrinogen dehydrogenase HemZ [Defluviitaleaceae bacterium]|nr:coproporphyrinogen dehydrogenase HemZ [Defluviitaleaceae bacterium]